MLIPETRRGYRRPMTSSTGLLPTSVHPTPVPPDPAAATADDGEGFRDCRGHWHSWNGEED
ncbi:hypothetical protein JCM18899A_26830 [Nocardioides sp. AN3]